MKNCFRDNILETEIQRHFMKTKNYVLFTLNKKSFLFTRIMISVQIVYFQCVISFTNSLALNLYVWYT